MSRFEVDFKAKRWTLIGASFFLIVWVLTLKAPKRQPNPSTPPLTEIVNSDCYANYHTRLQYTDEMVQATPFEGTRFFAVWNCKSSPCLLPSVYTQCLETIFFHHPKAQVLLYSNELLNCIEDDFSKAGYNLKVVRFDPIKLVEGLPGSDFMNELETHKREDDKFLVHYSDYLRLVLLYKYGGVYFDLDTLLLRPVPDYKNWVAVYNYDLAGTCVEDFCTPMKVSIANADGLFDPIVERKIIVVNGFMKFQKGHLILEHALAGLVKFYDEECCVYRESNGPHCWNCIGPRLLTWAIANTVNDVDDLTMIYEHIVFGFGSQYLPQVKPFVEYSVRKMCISLHLYGGGGELNELDESSLEARVIKEFSVLKDRKETITLCNHYQCDTIPLPT